MPPHTDLTCCDMLGQTCRDMLDLTCRDVLGLTCCDMLGLTCRDVLGLTYGDVLGLTYRDMLGLTCCDMFPVHRAEAVGSQRVEDLQRRLTTRLDGAAHKATPARGQFGAAEKHAVTYTEWGHTLSRGVAGNTLSRIQSGVTHCPVDCRRKTLSRIQRGVTRCPVVSLKNTLSRKQDGVTHCHVV